MLYNLSDITNGQLYYPASLGKLADEIVNKEDITEVAYEQKELTDIINKKWLFFIFLLIISAEWFIRKRNGIY